MTAALPSISDSLTKPPLVSMWARESAEWLRLSPMTQTLPAGTTTSKSRDLGNLGGVDVLLVQRRAVDGELAAGVAADDVVAGEPDDALDQVLFGVVREQADERQPVLDDGERPGCVFSARPGQPALVSLNTTTSPRWRAIGSAPGG